MKRSGIIFLLCIFLAGCTVPERFDNAPVDTDGAFHLNCRPAKVAAAWNEYCDAMLQSASAVPGAKGSETVKDLLFIKLLFRYLGINEMSALKMSSAETENGLFSNKIALEITSDNSAGISVIGSNKNIANEIGHLPADCSDVMAISWDFVKLWESIDKSKLEIRDQIVAHIKVILGTTPEKAAERHSGVWIISMRKPREKELLVLSVPDAGKHLFNRWKSLFSQNKDVFKMKISDNLESFVTHRNGRTELYPSQEELTAYCTAAKTLAGNSGFQNSAAKHFKNCVYASWSDKGDGHNKTFGSAQIPGKKLEYPEFFVFKRTEYGFYGYGLENQELSTILFRDHLLLLRNLIPEHLLSQPQANAEPQEKDVLKKGGQQEESVCFANLQKISKYLQMYAEKNNGAAPEGLHIDGLNKLIGKNNFDAALLCCPGSGCEMMNATKPLMADNTGYIYFGNWRKNNSDKLPLLMDFPENHNGFFHVLLRDGSVRKLTLKQQLSVKRMASYLHTVFKYNEEEFSELIRRAGELDTLLDKEPKQ